MPNITKEIQNTLKDLKQDESIMILLAEKGRVSVVLDIDTNRSVPNSQQRPKNSASQPVTKWQSVGKYVQQNQT